MPTFGQFAPAFIWRAFFILGSLTLPAKKFYEIVKSLPDTDIRISPSSSAAGALVSAVDLAAPQDDNLFARLRQAFHDHGVLFVRDQHVSPAPHLPGDRRCAQCADQYLPWAVTKTWVT